MHANRYLPKSPEFNRGRLGHHNCFNIKPSNHEVNYLPGLEKRWCRLWLVKSQASGIIQAGDIQIMSAGTGIRHSEYNASETGEVDLVQVWVIPKLRDNKPRYDQRTFEVAIVRINGRSSSARRKKIIRFG